MKYNMLGSQYEQLAIEKFRQTLNAVPFVSDVEVSMTGLQRGFGDFQALVHFTDNREPLKFAVDVKSNGEKRFVNLFMMMASQYHDDVCYMFMAPYISESSAEALYQNNYSYMDLSGNCYILTKHIIIHFAGQPNLYKDIQKKKDYFSKSSTAASTVLRTMLNLPFSCWQVKDLSERTGKAIGTVSNVKKFLQEHDWIKEYSSGFVLQNIEEILRSWARDYHLRSPRTVEYYSLDPVPKIESEIQFCNAIRDTNAVLGTFSAAARYAPTVRYNKVHVYVEQKNLDAFVCQLDLQPVSSGGNVVVTIPHDETPCMYARTINGDLVTSPVQTVIDLLGNSGRGEEAAEAIIQKEFR